MTVDLEFNPVNNLHWTHSLQLWNTDLWPRLTPQQPLSLFYESLTVSSHPWERASPPFPPAPLQWPPSVFGQGLKDGGAGWMSCLCGGVRGGEGVPEAAHRQKGLNSGSWFEGELLVLWLWGGCLWGEEGREEQEATHWALTAAACGWR